jgi:hypothetical protein
MAQIRQKPVAQKNPPLVSVAARESARGEECACRFSCCNRDASTTILAHLRMFGWAGTAQKPPDYLAVFACSACHDVLDRRNRAHEWSFEELLRALGETLIRQFQKGIFKCK